MALQHLSKRALPNLTEMIQYVLAVSYATRTSYLTEFLKQLAKWTCWSGGE
jgi:hypothetical protein